MQFNLTGTITIAAVVTFFMVVSLHTTVSSQNTTASQNSDSSRNVTETSVDIIEQEILQLIKCPGSPIPNDVVQNISMKYFTNYGDSEDSPENALYARFIERDLDCPEAQIFESVQLLTEIRNETTEHSLHTQGWLIKHYSANFLESIPPERFCVNNFDSNGAFSVKYCRTNCSTQACLPKCCLAEELCDITETGDECFCTDVGHSNWPSLAQENIGHHSGQNSRNVSFVHYLPDEFECKNVHVKVNRYSRNLQSHHRIEFQILDNGTTLFRSNSDKVFKSLPEGSYCIDGAIQSSTMTLSNPNETPITFSGDFTDMAVHFCQDDVEIVKTDDLLYRIFVPFAAAFITLTVIMYILTWSEQNVHGYTIFSYLMSLLFLYLLLVISTIPDIAQPICTFIAAALHFSYLSCTCWLTSISFNVWRTFKKMNTSSRIGRRRGRRTFLTLFLFSFGYPTLQVTACAVLDIVYYDFSKEAKNDLSFALADYGRGFICSMSNDGMTFYLYIPITILLGCNTAFFIATISSMIRYKKSIRDAFANVSNQASTSSGAKDNQSFGIYARLFIIMGIFWTTQIISWFTLKYLKDGSDEEEKLKLIFSITDALTVLQAVVIFYIFVCKKSVFGNLWNLHPCLRPFLKLWISGGCCSVPLVDPKFRKFSATQSTSAKSTLRSRKECSEEARLSRDSNSSILAILANNSLVEADISRKESVESTVTNMTQIEEKSRVHVSGGTKKVSFEETTETTM